jgi:hypothetical protein
MGNTPSAASRANQGATPSSPDQGALAGQGDLWPPFLSLPGDEPPAVGACPPLATGEGVLDEPTYRLLEVGSLFAAVNHTRTRVGELTLHRSLARPLADREGIAARQDALAELDDHPGLLLGIETLVKAAAAREPDMWMLLYGSFLGGLATPRAAWEAEGYGYDCYARGTRFFRDLVDAAHTLSTARSPYLQGLIGTLRGLAGSRAHDLMAGPVYVTEAGIRTRAEKHPLTPAYRFRPHLFKPALLAVVCLFFFLLSFYPPIAVTGLAQKAAPLLIIFLFPALLIYVPIVGGFDRDSCIYPLRQIFRADPAVQAAVDALGALDELLAFRAYRAAFGHPMVLPTLREGPHHRLRVAGARNPILAKGAPDYVGNDLDLDEVPLLFVTGPNSGGKTAFCKTLAQCQLLAQIGCYCPAATAECTVADRIFYQCPEGSALADGEGRFGRELLRTKEVFLAASPRSLVILDELSEGTTFAEKMRASEDILDGFRGIGNHTLLITHNHELVSYYAERGIGAFRQAEFQGEAATFRLVPGISRVSHADRVAERIGFSRADIAQYLSEKGYSGEARAASGADARPQGQAPVPEPPSQAQQPAQEQAQPAQEQAQQQEQQRAQDQGHDRNPYPDSAPDRDPDHD